MRPDPYEALRKYARRLEAEVDPAAARRAAAAAVAATGRPRRRRLVPALALAFALIVGNAGLALAANPSVPGEALYGLDRAYERLAAWVGLGSDTRAERLSEAGELHAHGRLAEALAIAAEAVGNDQNLTQAATALAEAPGQDQTAALHDQTEELLKLAKQVVDAAQSGDPEAASEAARALRLQATLVAAAARAQGPGASPEDGVTEQGGPPESVPGDTAPGRGNTRP